MSHKLIFKNKKDAFNVLKAHLFKKGYKISNPKEISYGMQFIIEKDQKSDLVRIYSSSKGTKIDESQMKNDELMADVLEAFKITPMGEKESPFEKGSSKLYCLMIGINKFKDKLIHDLSYAKEDAEELYSDIIGKAGFGDGAYHLNESKATKKNILKKLVDLKKIAKKEDTVLIFIASHGDFKCYNDKNDYYIMAFDTNSDDIESTAISMSSLRNAVSEIRSERKVIFLDTCYSGGISRDNTPTRISDSVKEDVFNRLQNEEYIIITSSQATQKSFECDKIKHGVFTYYLLMGLKGMVESRDKLVELPTLYLYIHQSVREFVSKTYKAIQEPKFFGAFTGSFGLPLLVDIADTGQQITSEKKKFKFESVKCVGIDESGKGDYFGPLTVAAVYVDSEDKLTRLRALGVKDSKKIPDDKIGNIAKQITKICDVEVLHITPERYNQMYSNMSNLNSVLAWSHAQCLEQVLKRNKECNIAISDQFTSKDVLLNRLKTLGKKIELIQRPKAEENIAVAAASILARDKYNYVMQLMMKTYKFEFLKGASEAVKTKAIDFVIRGGNLKEVAKLHFKSTKEIIRRAKEINPKLEVKL